MMRQFSSVRSIKSVQSNRNSFFLSGITAAAALLGFTLYNPIKLYLDNNENGDQPHRAAYSAEDFVHATEDGIGNSNYSTSSITQDSSSILDEKLMSSDVPTDGSEVVIEHEVLVVGPDGKPRRRRRRRKCHIVDEEDEMLHLEFLKLQDWVKENKRRVLIIIEGRDTAGKGGAIRYFTLHLNPKYYRVITFRKPTEEEKGEWYFQRYIKELPNPGEITFFYHSWYNRAIVEPVMNECTELEYKRFMRDVVHLEDMLNDDGVIIVKFWFSITKDIQAQRLRAPAHNPLKKWKMKPHSDWRVLTLFHLISRFRDEMFSITSSNANPWVVVSSINKPLARKEALRYVLSVIPYKGREKSEVNLTPDPQIVIKANETVQHKSDFELLPTQPKVPRKARQTSG